MASDAMTSNHPGSECPAISHAPRSRSKPTHSSRKVPKRNLSHPPSAFHPNQRRPKAEAIVQSQKDDTSDRRLFIIFPSFVGLPQSFSGNITQDETARFQGYRCSGQQFTPVLHGASSPRSSEAATGLGMPLPWRSMARPKSIRCHTKFLARCDGGAFRFRRRLSNLVSWPAPGGDPKVSSRLGVGFPPPTVIEILPDF